MTRCRGRKLLTTIPLLPENKWIFSPFTVAPNKQLPNREPAKRTACTQQKGLKIQSTSSAKGVVQQQRIPEHSRRGALQEWSRRAKPARPCFFTLGGETSRAMGRVREIIHNLFPYNFGHVYLIYTISFIPGHISK